MLICVLVHNLWCRFIKVLIQDQEAFNKIHPEMLLCMPFMWRHLSRLQSIWMNTCCNRARGQHRHLLFVSSILFCSFVLCASICRYLFESIPSIKKVSFPTNIYVCCLLYISHASMDIQFFLFALGSSQHTDQEAFNKIHPEMLLCMPFMWRHLSRLQSIWMNTCCFTLLSSRDN